VTSFKQFRSKAKMRHDFSDQIQVRYIHPSGESFDTWVSGDEVLQRLDTRARERLIRSFSQKDWRQARDSIKEELDKGKHDLGRRLKDRLADAVTDSIGDHIWSETLSDKIRGVDSQADPYEVEKAKWQQYLKDDAFRAIVLKLAWINLEGTFPAEDEAELDDWS
jgi:hypothetical protein